MMKNYSKLLGFCIVLLFINACRTQPTLFISSDKFNFLRPNVMNPISISHLNCILSTDNGELIKKDNKYFIIPNRIGRCSIYVKCGNKEKQEFLFEVIPFEQKPKIWLITSQQHGQKAKITDVIGVRFISDVGYHLNIEIKSFEIKVLREGELLFSHTNDGYLFDYNLKEALENVKKGDLLIINNVKAVYTNGNEVVDIEEYRHILK